ncbi:tripartite tricarboxylate transporter substrate binding protein [Planomicrobium okeanokoites]|uniref:Tripartite tricarboxylate transporter substrate binding protein n=1 Tax=Planomicrobium okeanokoites TaxID=244 RepID=A0ABV7KS02_PLAOK|nr:tripartite tricarboxylate transporter substrate binding protein [Planomicrobium okeanokoites]
MNIFKKSKMFKTATAAVAAGLLLAGCSSEGSSGSAETAEGYPNKQIQLMLPWGAGGDSDVIARTINKYLEEELDVKIVVTNMGGGGGTIGAQEFMKQNPDGYSMLAGHDSIAVSHLMGKADFSYDDFEPVSLMTTANQLIATNVANDWENMQDVVDELKENPESISFGASIGSTTHIVPLGIMDSQDVKFNIVAYEGTAQRTQALLGNHLDLGSTTIPAAKEYMKANQLKMLGIASEERNPALPDIPTLKEQGIDFVNATNRGYFFPKDTPQEIVDVMDEALKNVAENPEFIKEMEAMGVDVNYKDTEEYTNYLEDDVEHLEGMLTRQNIIE